MNCTRSFKRDWITRRAIKLVGEGMSAKDARAQAKADWEVKDAELKARAGWHAATETRAHEPWC